jgi:hypothetical protein
VTGHRWLVDVVKTEQVLVVVGILLVACTCQSAVAQELVAPNFISYSLEGRSNPPLKPEPSIAISSVTHPQTSVDWKQLALDTIRFGAVQHAFRCATEEGTREAFGNSFVRGYLRSVGNLHGWADGDPFYVNYVGHPMQGAVASFIWANNDPAYGGVSIGSDPRYWKAKLRGLAFAYAESVVFEIGPLSEASIGNIQATFPQQGFVDHVITPTFGMAWGLGEDALDRYVIRRVEAHAQKQWVRILVRSGLNPARAMANVMGGETPWHRNDRPGVRSYVGAGPVPTASTQAPRVIPPRGVDRFDFTSRTVFREYFGTNSSGPCVGAEGEASFRVTPEWQAVLNVGGCKSLGLGRNVSGDSLDYLAGTRWTPQVSTRWTPRLELLVGGTKVTQERMFSDVQQALSVTAKQNEKLSSSHALHTKDSETNGLAMRAGVAIDVKLSNALALQLAHLGYAHTWVNNLSGINYRNNLQFSSGLVLRMGSW